MIKEYAHAKLNLALDVPKKRDDGYHELQMIMIPLELSDILTFELHEDIILNSNVDIEDNLIIKAAKKLKETHQVKHGAQITLEKHIPIGGGLAGGSADIAATLRGLNKLWELHLELEDLDDLALSLGSDTLFCLYNKPAMVFGRGEHIMFTDMPPIENIYLFPSKTAVSTAYVFKHHIIAYQKRRFDRLSISYLNNNYEEFFKKTYNALQKTTLRCYPELKKHFRKIRHIHPYVTMTGSGSTFYILSFPQNHREIDEKVSKSHLEVIKTKPKT